MKGFIEVRLSEDRKQLINIDKIVAVEELTEKTTEIMVDFTPDKRRSWKNHLFAVESYDEVVAKIEKALK